MRVYMYTHFDKQFPDYFLAVVDTQKLRGNYTRIPCFAVHCHSVKSSALCVVSGLPLQLMGRMKQLKIT